MAVLSNAHIFYFLVGIQIVFCGMKSSIFHVKPDQKFNVTNPIYRRPIAWLSGCAGWCNGLDRCKAANFYKPPAAHDDQFVCDLLSDVGSSDLIHSPGSKALIMKIDECVPVNPCANGGTCHDQKIEFECSCPAGFTGGRCDAVDYCGNNPCQNGGTCVSRPSYFTCVCPSMWTGAVCECRETFHGRVETVTVGSTEMEVFVETDGEKEWIVLMRRHDGNEDFVNKAWADYKGGFGGLCSEFWLGNDNIYYLTNNGSSWTVRFDLQSIDGEWRHAEYTTFSVDSEAYGYNLTIGGHSGDLGDQMTHHNGQMFTTIDRDNDNSAENCATWLGGGWWYTSCGLAKLTGPYGVVWNHGIKWQGWRVEFKHADMKIRAV